MASPPWRDCAVCPTNSSSPHTAACSRNTEMVPYGQALILSGKSAEGIPSLKGLTVWDTAGGKVRSPTTNMFLAEGMALTGDLDDALRLIDGQIV
jgi:hypothetical protein